MFKSQDLPLRRGRPKSKADAHPKLWGVKTLQNLRKPNTLTSPSLSCTGALSEGVSPYQCYPYTSSSQPQTKLLQSDHQGLVVQAVKALLEDSVGEQSAVEDHMDQALEAARYHR